jgi:hypothetical protein
MSANAIWFEENEERFFFDGIPVRKEKIGRVISESLMSGNEYVELGGVTVTVNYLTEMLRWTGKFGWFYDITDNTSDHRFDTNQITPGHNWGEYQEYLELARTAERKANDKRRSTRTAAELRQSATEYRDQATEIFGLYRNTRRMPGKRNAR